MNDTDRALLRQLLLSALELLEQREKDPAGFRRKFMAFAQEMALLRARRGQPDARLSRN